MLQVTWLDLANQNASFHLCCWKGFFDRPDSDGQTRLRPHSTPATLCWLERNYELSEGVCIPRNVVYFNYVDFCSKSAMQPVNAASFGKVSM